MNFDGAIRLQLPDSPTIRARGGLLFCYTLPYKTIDLVEWVVSNAQEFA